MLANRTIYELVPRKSKPVERVDLRVVGMYGDMEGM